MVGGGGGFKGLVKRLIVTVINKTQRESAFHSNFLERSYVYAVPYVFRQTATLRGNLNGVPGNEFKTSNVSHGHP